MRHFFWSLSLLKYVERKFTIKLFFEKGLEEQKMYSSFYVSQQWLEVCTSWHFASAYDLIMLLVSSYDQIT